MANIKYYKPFLLILFFLCCRCKSPIPLSSRDIIIERDFEIVKIDSIDNTYVIYAKNDKRIYKIASTKEKTTCKETVTVKNSYRLKIQSVHQVKIANLNDISGIYFNETFIKFEGDSIIWDLFYTNNIKSLCYFP